MTDEIRELCYNLAISANDLGYQGKRVIGITIIEPSCATDGPVPKFIYTIDDGPKSGSESWEDR